MMQRIILENQGFIPRKLSNPGPLMGELPQAGSPNVPLAFRVLS
jgi:hypothetical protein